ncbi:endonuclease/exonuclease/phosphatase family protein [Streptosporangium sp. NPDC000396]|uniref:endonuclease/exonuclease/phosphatase family protein n=1 Tax=Streptosporangium sp. NPDC000396 TaxID=3366185 RepID=UPI00368759BE
MSNIKLVSAVLSAFLVAAATPPAHAASKADDVRVLAWNIWHGGKDPAVGGEANLPLLIDQLADIAPDVFLSIETYGSAEDLRAGLSAEAGKGEYTATRITSRTNDNLWIFTHYPITQVYPKPVGGIINDFYFGGIRVKLPSGREANFFDTWLNYSDPWVGDMIDANAAAIQKGEAQPYTAEQVVKGDTQVQLPQITDIIHNHLPAMLAGNTDPVILGGDFNTLPAADWTRGGAHCHYGLSYDLQATDVVTDAGFVDTYRAANRNVCKSPGKTWSPQPDYDYMITKDRIDFIFAKGTGVKVRDSFTVDQRLASHGPGKFYSDHAAMVTDLRISR